MAIEAVADNPHFECMHRAGRDLADWLTKLKEMIEEAHKLSKVVSPPRLPRDAAVREAEEAATDDSESRQPQPDAEIGPVETEEAANV